MKHPLRVFEDKCNNVTDPQYYYYFQKIINLFTNRFKWNGLPDYIPPAFLEQTLFFNGRVAFIYDDVEEMFAVMNVNLTGMPDIYNVPDMRQVFAVTGYTETYGKDESVIIWDNPCASPFVITADLYAKQLANIWKTRDINILAQRTPIILKSTMEERLTWANVGNQYEMYVPMIKADTSLDMENIQALDLKAEWKAGALTELERLLWSQVLTDMGYESNPVDKKERLISQEVQGNNGETEGNRKLALNMRQRACEQINRLWGLNMSVEFNTELPTPLNGFSPYQKQEDSVRGGGDGEPVDN